MSSNEPPAMKENNLEELKAKLDDFIARNSITQFEGEDIIELVEEGEAVDWIVEQLKGNSPGMNADEVTPLLADIKTLIGPAEEPAYEEEEEPQEGEIEAEPLIEGGIPDLSQLDPSKLDLSQLADALPPGMKLPPGFNMKQLQDIMESPQGQVMSDFLMFCQEKGIELNEGSMNDPRTQELQEEWKSTPREAFEGKTPGEMLEENPGLMPGKVETFRRETPRVGRNDPCPCGSGKKYKKCCGRA
jgi:hypothetical protein